MAPQKRRFQVARDTHPRNINQFTRNFIHSMQKFAAVSAFFPLDHLNQKGITH